MSPINEFRDGSIKRIIGNAYRISSFKAKKVPEINPISEEIITMINDSLKIFLKYSIHGTPKTIIVIKKQMTVRKSSIAVIIGLTTLFGSKPDLKAKWFMIVETGNDIDKVRNIEIKGIIRSVNGGMSRRFSRKKSSDKANIPIMIAVINDSEKVAKIFCRIDFLLNSPMIRSREVRAM